ncbi:MAG: VWA domain-containing protein [Gammaproteobacteria bacterium]|nr:VWA domain-containing protein [Gammaproteobacteria bacterium]MCY4358125.1 VWA domain-containing protein [Gammaproteobacteria bacterium]
MKDPSKPVAKPAPDSGNKSVRLVSSKRDVASFLNKVANLPTTAGAARLIFALDATASRQPTWDLATQLQAEMFTIAQSLGGLTLQLCYFRGLGQFFSSDWHSDGNELLQLMTRIHCEAGATQLEQVLRHAMRQQQSSPVKGIVFIGDAMEEDRNTLTGLAGKLGLLNVPLFIFQEGAEPLAQQVFLELSRLSGGACMQFDRTSAGQLKDLLRAVAVYAAGGRQALSNFSKTSSETVRLLQQQLKS